MTGPTTPFSTVTIERRDVGPSACCWTSSTPVSATWKLAGSMSGGMPETQEILDFCAEHGIKPEIEVIAGEGTGQGRRPARGG
jgi:hypothetical protein